MKILVLALTLSTSALPAAAMPSEQLKRSVESGLQGYGFEVDIDTLSTNQLAALHHFLHSDLSNGEKRRQIRSALGGTYSLRELLFR